MTHTRRARLSKAAGAGLAMLALAAVSACGSRTPLSAVVAAEGGAQTDSTGASTTNGGGTGPATTGSGTTGSALGTTTGSSSAAGTTGTSGSTSAATSGSRSGGGSTSGSTGSSSGGTTGVTAAGCTKSLSPIKIGEVGGWTGLVSNILLPTRTAMQVWVKDTNARGGVACHPIQLFQADDGGDPSRAAADIQDLVQNKGVVALVGNQVTLSMAGFRSKAEQLHVPAVGGDLLTYDWFQSPMMFPQGGDLTGDVLGAVKVQASRGHKKVGMIYCVEAKTCSDAAGIMDRQVSKTGASLVYKTQVSITQTDFSAECQAAKSAGADQVLLAMDGSSISRIMKSCKALSYTPAIATSPIAVGSTVTSDPNVTAVSLSVGAATTPWTQAVTAAEKRYHQAMATYAPGMPIDGATNVAWVSGELFARAITSLGAAGAGTITSELVLKGLGTIKNDNLDGLTLPLTFKPGQTTSPVKPCYFPALLDGSGWHAPSGQQYFCF
jgi:branched-chain amino acid transport system substrate-binding protein